MRKLILGLLLLPVLAQASSVGWGGNAAIAASATNLTSLLTLGQTRYATKVVVKNSAASTANVYCGNSNVTVTANIHIELVPGQAYDFVSIGNRLIVSDDIYCIGTVAANNKIVVNAYE